ncbi:abortive infection system antitoxin AbiGi family protein [Aquibacillus sediminis]|uniref:abortive infection system antitoxin AbiGi family protein n=1 Tax=Aquibacillus sediminis TaxID=2574734 RepID=UPI001107D3FC|nr:abortive infection system antitoxin AbiGi family protein [Aquibacillus sediminis]
MSKPRYYSNIYWHFTGGPVSIGRDIIWHHYRCLKDVKNNTTLKQPQQAMENLQSIISSKVLKATCTEKISESIETEMFCSVCDIPLNDLVYHRQYYGDYAIGFNADIIHKHFHPVLYIDPYYASLNRPEIRSRLSETDGDRNKPMLWELIGIKKENPLLNFLKITSFASNYEQSFYGEREWRCLQDFAFNPSEVEAIIVPKQEVQAINYHLRASGYQNISVLSWDLIENV